MKDKNLRLPIILISVAIPAVVVCLFAIPHRHTPLGADIRLLPLLNAVLNSTTFLLLLGSYLAIRMGNRRIHRRLNLIAVGLSVLFLLSYVTYHYLSPQAYYGGHGWIRPVYFVILITHIVLSAVIVPLVLITLVRGLKGNFARHRAIARYTWPLWLYVTLSGVVVYLMMAPYY